MSDINKDFFDLLNSISDTETFSLTLTDNKEYIFKQLSTSQLKELIKTVVDSPVTQVIFNNTVSRIMKESLVTEGVDAYQFNIVDRLLFILETRIQSISPLIFLSNDGTTVEVNLQDSKNKIIEEFKKSDHVVDQVAKTPITEIAYNIPLLSTELQLNEEFYKDTNINIESQEELRKLLGETFINEIAKTIKTITIQDKVLELNSVSFKSRVETVGKLPASLVNSVIKYIEKYKKIIEQGLLTDAGISIPIDGSLFSMR